MIQKKKSLSPEEIAFNKLALLPKGGESRISLRRQCQIVWEQYGSKYFRYKDALERGNVALMVRCCTCSVVKYWTEFQGGHFIPKAKLDAWLEEDNSHCQCDDCNVRLEGNTKMYTDFMLKKYGSVRVAELLSILHSKTSKVTAQYIQERKKHFQNKLKEWGI